MTGQTMINRKEAWRLPAYAVRGHRGFLGSDGESDYEWAPWPDPEDTFSTRREAEEFRDGYSRKRAAEGRKVPPLVIADLNG